MDFVESLCMYFVDFVLVGNIGYIDVGMDYVGQSCVGLFECNFDVVQSVLCLSGDIIVVVGCFGYYYEWFDVYCV